MRRLSLQCLQRGQLLSSKRPCASPLCGRYYVPSALARSCPRRFLANVKDPRDIPELWFSSSTPSVYPFEGGGGKDHEPPSERKLKLGKTIRILHERLPSLLATPLPQDILSPNISLRLFPSTHPHLPTVSGRLAYTAALWTSPVAWGRVPVVGNVKLVITSERMMRGLASVVDESPDNYDEKLVVRWKTCGKAKGELMTEQIKKMMTVLGGNNGVNKRKTSEEGDFHGLFIFEFDSEGRIKSHTIEHVEEGHDWEKTARLISVTDWLLGKAWGKPEGVPGIAFCRTDENDFTSTAGKSKR